MSKTAKIINAVICALVILSQITVMYGAIVDFDDAKSWFEVFKALFWLILSTAAFYLATHHLLNKKPIWSIWK